MSLPSKRAQKGELLLMALLAIAILAIVAGMVVPVLANRLDDARLVAERSTLATFHRDFEATFDAVSFDQNESSLPGTGLPAGTAYATFDDPAALTARVYAGVCTVDPNGWLTRLAAKRGITSEISGASYPVLADNEYTRLAFNAFGGQRCLLLGPADETGRQRYLILSLMAPAFRGLTFPGGDATALFNSLWDQSWDALSAQVPAGWSSLLNAEQVGLWNSVSTGGRSNAGRLIVERIVQPKFTVTVANNSATDTAWIDLGPSVNAIVAPAGAGVFSSAAVAGCSTGVLEGRLVVMRRGASVATAVEVQRFFLYSDVNLTVQ